MYVTQKMYIMRISEFNKRCLRRLPDLLLANNRICSESHG